MPYKQMIQDQISGSPYYDPKPSLDTFSRALELLEIAKALDLNLTEVDFLERTCRFGSLQGYVKSVIEYCEHAVQLSVEDPSTRDSRGLARALTGDFEGAILDFRFFIENSVSSELIAERQRWITELEAGKNPFTPDVLEKLKRE